MRAPVWQLWVPLLALLAPPACQGVTCPDVCDRCTDSRVECPRFTLAAEGENVDVRCPDWNADEFADINATLLTAWQPLSKQLTFSNCAIPANRSLADTIAFLGPLSSVTELFFVTNGNNNHSAPLAPVLFEGLDSLRNLSLKCATNDPIGDPDLFMHLPQLEWLDLREYGGSTLPAGLLRPLPALRTFEYRQNKGLTSLPAGLLTDLPQLRKVIMFGNPLTHLERFTGTPLLEHLDLIGNRLGELPADMFAELPRLSVLWLASNRLAALPERLLQNNTALEKFNASHQKNLTALPEKLFAGLRKLTHLDLSHNRLQTLPAKLLADQQSLVTLDLSYNGLESLDIKLLENLKALVELRLDHNHLRIIDSESFARQRWKLDSLELSQSNTSLQERDREQDKPPIVMLETPFVYLDKLSKLYLSHNALVTVFGDFHYFMNALTVLDLSHNRIVRLEYGQLSFASNKLERLDLSHNRIRVVEFPHAPSGGNQPKEIVLNGNPLDCNCKAHAFVRLLQRGWIEPPPGAGPESAASDRKRFAVDELTCDDPPVLRGTPVSRVPPLALTCATGSGVCPPECSCQSRPEDRTIIVDCTARNLTSVPSLASLAAIDYSLELLLQDNELVQVPNATAAGWQAVVRLNVSNNQLATLPAALPAGLEQLDATGNWLAELDPQLAKRLGQLLPRVSLADNRWACECGAPLLLFAQAHYQHIGDFAELQCANGRPITVGLNDELCNPRKNLIVALCAAGATVVLVVALLALYYRYRMEVKVWLFTHNLLQWLTSEEELDRDKQYDGFVSYSGMDEEFIAKHLVPTLESPPMNFRICWHVRDFMPGEMIAAQITKAVEQSRRTIVVLSANYLESVWGQMEFKAAYLQSIEDKRNRVIAIIYDDIGNVDDLDPELRAYLKTNTYVRWDDPWFWDKLRYAMPHPRQVRGAQATDNMRMASMDQLNLIAPVPNGAGCPRGAGDAGGELLPPESTPPVQQGAKGAGGAAENPLAKLYAPKAGIGAAAVGPAFTISSNRLDLHPSV